MYVGEQGTGTLSITAGASILVASSLWVKARVLVEPRRSLVLARRGQTLSFALLVRTVWARST